MATNKKLKLDPGSGNGSGGGGGDGSGSSSDSSAPSFMGDVPNFNCSFDYILKIAAVDPAFLSRVKDMLGDEDPLITFRTLFVRGFGWDATVDTLREAFEPYGRIEDCRVAAVDDPSRYPDCSGGVGLVVFDTPQNALKAIESPHKNINNHLTHTQLPFPGRPLVIFPHPDYTPVFVSNVPHSAAAAYHFEARFKELGQFTYGPFWLELPRDHAVIVMRTPEDAAKAVQEPKKTIFGLEVQCSISIDTVFETAKKEVMEQVESAYNTYGLDSSSKTGVFVNHLHEELDDDKLKEFFTQFGEIVAGPIPFLPETDCSWRFALFIYKTSEEADNALLGTQGKTFDGHPLLCQASPDDFTKQTVMADLDWGMKQAKFDQQYLAEQLVTRRMKSSNQYLSGAEAGWEVCMT